MCTCENSKYGMASSRVAAELQQNNKNRHLDTCVVEKWLITRHEHGLCVHIYQSKRRHTKIQQESYTFS